MQCNLCPQGCFIRPGRTGVCRVRKNIDQTLYTVNYGQVSSLAVDPIEKKPLYHFYPGTTILSAGTIGCNLSCGFCQNWHISQAEADTRYLSPSAMVELAQEQRRKNPRMIGIAYTYSEPLMWYEWVLDVSREAKERGLLNVLVTNGYIRPEPLSDLAPEIDAANVDLKAFSDEFYRRTCGGRLGPVMDTIGLLVKKGVHVEVTTLLIAGENDGEEEIAGIARWLAEIDPAIPYHISRYFPHYKYTKAPTPTKTLLKAYDIAREYLFYVYLGNIGGGQWSDTLCPRCKNTVVARYPALSIRLEQGKCPDCGEHIPVKYRLGE